MVCASLIVALLTAASTASAHRVETEPGLVTVIGDSVMTAVIWHPEPLALLTDGEQIQMEVAVCRRLTGTSCPYEGGRPPTLVDLVDALGPRLGKTVVVEAGYNDPEEGFSDAVHESVAALARAGVTRILWLTLAEARPAYAEMNRALVAVAAGFPELTVVDWNGASGGHPDWFQNDGIHLTFAGGVGLAQLLRDAIDGFEPSPLTPPVATITPVVIPAKLLPVARVGRRYPVRMVALGGAAPYRWSVRSGSLPKGLRFDEHGWISGIPRVTCRARPVFSVQDRNGLSSSRGALLVVEP